MTTIFVIRDLEGEFMNAFSSRSKAERWLEAYVRSEIAKGYYGAHLGNPELTWVNGDLGFVHSAFGRLPPVWRRVNEDLGEYELDPVFGEETR